MRTAVAVMAGAALLTACAAQLWSRPEPAEVWLLMGQSNMSGRGDLADLPGSMTVADPRIRLLANDGVIRPALEPLDAAEGQIDTVSADDLAAVGPGLAFARARVAANGVRRILLVPCAKGGTSIVEWAPAEARSTLFGSCVARAREASRHGRLTGALWYQGESDARTLALAQAWRGRFDAMLVALRSALARPDLPMLVVSLGDRVVGPGEARPPGWDHVQAEQMALSGDGLLVVPATSLSLKPDGLHLSTAGQLRLGQQLAIAAEGLAPTRPDAPENDSY